MQTPLINNDIERYLRRNQKTLIIGRNRPLRLFRKVPSDQPGKVHYDRSVGGAVDGVIGGLGLLPGVGTLCAIGLGTLGGGAGDFVEQSINLAFGNQEEFDLQGVIVSSAISVVPNAGSEFATKGIKNFGDRVIKSDATKRQLEKMFKTEAKNQGKKIKNKELSKKVGDRTKEMLEANKDMEKFNSIALDNIIDFNDEIYGDDR